MKKLILMVSMAFLVTPQVWAGGSVISKKSSFEDKLGLFRVDQSTDDSVCRPLARIINQDISRYGKTQFENHSQFVKWQKVDEANIDRGEYKYDGDIEQAEIDINNDAMKERVIKTGWLIRGVSSYRLDALPLDQKIIYVDKLATSEHKVEFNEGKYSIGNYVKKYGHENYDWYFDGVTSINLFRNHNKTYALAQNYAAPNNVSAKIYIFRLDKSYEPQNVCMLVKI